MVSRLGDIGITDDLTTTNYLARIGGGGYDDNKQVWLEGPPNELEELLTNIQVM